MKKNMLLICMTLFLFTTGIFAAQPAKSLKENAKTESSTVKRFRVPDNIPVRKSTKHRIPSIASQAMVSAGNTFNQAPLYLGAATNSIYGWLNYYDDPTHEWANVGMNQVLTDGSYSTMFKCWDSPSIAFYHDNMIHTYLTLFDMSGIYLEGSYYTAYDFETGQVMIPSQPIDLGDDSLGAFINMAYNHDDNTAYGYTYDYSSSTSVSFAKIIMTNPTNVIRVKSDVNTNEICTAMTYHDGKLHGINFDGEYVTITLQGNQTPHFTPVFENGNTSTLNYGSLIYSDELDAFLWANMYDADNSSHLFKLDTTTETVTKLADYTRQEQFIGFFSPSYEENPAAPNYIEIVSNTFEGTPNTFGSLTFRVPNTTIAGTAIPETEEIEVTLNIGGEETLVETYAPGTEATIELQKIPEGLNTFTFTGALGDKKTRKSYPYFIGYDEPKAPKNVTLSVERITWDPVTESVHGGYFEADNVTYTVYLNDQKIASGITETSVDCSFDGFEFEAYIAEVIAESNGKKSNSSYSNGIIAGDAVLLDYYCEPAAEDISLYTVVNDSEGTSTWLYREANGMTYKEDCFEMPAYDVYTGNYGANDWLILPPLKFENSNELYSIAIDAANTLDMKNTLPLEAYAVNYTIYLGTAPTPDAMTTVIGEKRAIGHTTFETYADKFPVNEAGTYYIGIHADYTPTIVPLPVSLLLRNINVRAENVSLGGPGAVTDVVITPGANGALEAKVEFNLPTTSIDGTAIPENTTVKAYVETSVAYSPVEGKPGERISMTVETVQGDNIVNIIPYIDNNRGYVLEFNVYTGVDVPGIVENLTETISDDNLTIKLTWEAPTTGSNGGYVSPTGVKYLLARPTANGWEVIEEIGTDVYEYTYNMAASDYMQIVQIGIVAANAAGESPAIAVAGGVLGKPYELPMIESFPSGFIQYGPGLSFEPDVTYSAMWRITELYYDDVHDIEYRREDGSGYALACSPRRTAPNSRGRWGFPKFSTVNATEALLKFDMWISPDMPTVEIYAEAAGVEMQLIETFEPENFEGWEVKEVVLPAEFINKGWVAVYVDVSFSDFNQIYFLDNYEFKDNLANDFEATRINGKRNPSICNDATYNATITNRGYNTLGAPEGKWQVIQNGAVIAEEAIPSANTTLKEHETITYEFTFNATADQMGEAQVIFTLTTPDDKSVNNVATFDIEIERGSAIAITDLEAKANADFTNVELSWSKPESNQLVEGFEYEPTFDANATQLGDFKNIDGDGLETYGYNGWYRPNINPATGHGEAASFIVWNEEEANNVAKASGASVNWTAHSGDNFAIAFVPFPTAEYVVPDPADDWLISPEIKGGSTISFAACPLSYSYGPEVIRVMASDSNDDILSFYVVKTIEVGKYSNPNSTPTWEIFTVELPENARHFALNYVSQDIFGLMLDDITYTPNVPNDVLSYTIYRNGEMISSGSSAEFFTDSAVEYGKTYSYNVMPILTNGEGNMSNTATVQLTGIDNITNQNLIIGSKGAIIIKGFEGKAVAIHTTDGKTIYNDIIKSHESYFVTQPGVYVVTANGKSVKVIVK